VHPNDGQHASFFPSSSTFNLLLLSFALPPIPFCNLLLNNSDDDTTQEKSEAEEEETGVSAVGGSAIRKRDPPCTKERVLLPPHFTMLSKYRFSVPHAHCNPQNHDQSRNPTASEIHPHKTQHPKTPQSVEEDQSLKYAIARDKKKKTVEMGTCANEESYLGLVTIVVQSQ
jgi:hypothetical protein